MAAPVSNIGRTIVRVDCVTKAFRDFEVLKDVTFTLQEGKMFGLIGPNGAGKTTLVNILLGFDTDFEGSVEIEKGVRMAYIPQIHRSDQYALPLSVYEFLRVGMSNIYNPQAKHTDEAIVTTLAHVGLESSHLERSIHDISGGERQRALIARALLTNPNMLVLDEPLAFVDYPARESIYTLLKHLNQEHNISIILVSHDVDSIIPICDEILCLNRVLRMGCHPIDFIEGTTTKRVIEHSEIE